VRRVTVVFGGAAAPGRTPALVLVLVLGFLGMLALAVPGVAAADAYTTIDRVYNQNNGTIPLCRFSNAQLQAALSQAPTYEQEYLADFTDAVQLRISAQANGECKSGSALSTLARTTPLAQPAGRTPALPASITSSSGAGIPLPLLIGGLIAVICLTGTLLIAGLRWMAIEPRWLTSTRHSLDEAGHRLGLSDHARRR
jgi:hypothetical protein